MKKTIRLGSFLLAFLLLVCTLPVTAWAATTVDLNQNYLFRPRDNAFSFGAGETATLTFTPQYTAEYTLNLNGHGDGGGGRNIKASLTKKISPCSNRFILPLTMLQHFFSFLLRADAHRKTFYRS